MAGTTEWDDIPLPVKAWVERALPTPFIRRPGLGNPGRRIQGANLNGWNQFDGGADSVNEAEFREGVKNFEHLLKQWDLGKI